MAAAATGTQVLKLITRISIRMCAVRVRVFGCAEQTVEINLSVAAAAREQNNQTFPAAATAVDAGGWQMCTRGARARARFCGIIIINQSMHGCCCQVRAPCWGQSNFHCTVSSRCDHRRRMASYLLGGETLADACAPKKQKTNGHECALIDIVYTKGTRTRSSSCIVDGVFVNGRSV